MLCSVNLSLFCTNYTVNIKKKKKYEIKIIQCIQIVKIEYLFRM